MLTEAMEWRKQSKWRVKNETDDWDKVWGIHTLHNGVKGELHKETEVKAPE